MKFDLMEVFIMITALYLMVRDIIHRRKPNKKQEKVNFKSACDIKVQAADLQREAFVEWCYGMHLQNLNDRLTEIEAFKEGIAVAYDEIIEPFPECLHDSFCDQVTVTHGCSSDGDCSFKDKREPPLYFCGHCKSIPVLKPGELCYNCQKTITSQLPNDFTINPKTEQNEKTE